MTDQQYADVPDDVDVDPTAYRVEKPGRSVRLASAHQAPIGQAVMFEDIEQAARDASPALSDRFGVNPFSVLDTRSGTWQKRKGEWLALGIQSEIGRGDTLLFANQERLNEIKNDTSRRGADARSNLTGQAPSALAEANGMTYMASGTSIFDPVLCEAVYDWFCPKGGSVFDPFAGGSVRGITAAMGGHPYTGIDLSGPQVAANRQQAHEILGAPGLVHNPAEMTPIQEVGRVWLKRDDLFGVAGVRGGKVRTCLALAQAGSGPLVTASSRHSPQAVIVAAIARYLGRQAHLVVPAAQGTTPELEAAMAIGCTLEEVRPGYNTVLVKRARDAAASMGGTYIPFGMEHQAAVDATMLQVANLPAEAKRIVVPVGSGMTLAGVVAGLRGVGRDLPVLGVQVGADPTARLNEYAPGWGEVATLVESEHPYDHAVDAQVGDVALDQHYEAKCVEYLESGDVLWVVGLRATQQESSLHPVPHWYTGDSRFTDDLLPPGEQYDLVFTCPPYYDLEVYSDDPADLSAAPDYASFLAMYTSALKAAERRLRADRFYVVVVGEIRDKAGFQRGLVPDTIRICRSMGLHLYNEAVLYTPAGTLQLRVPKQFVSGRKMGRTHQSVLVFWKGAKAPKWGEDGP